MATPTPTTVDPRLALMSALNDPPYDEVAGRRGTSLDGAAQLLNAHRAAVLREAAAAVAQLIEDGEHDPDCLVDELRRLASEA